jgi:hypothetical protein
VCESSFRPQKGHGWHQRFHKFIGAIAATAMPDCRGCLIGGLSIPQGHTIPSNNKESNPVAVFVSF